jgi:hypothetical protein
MLIREGPCPPVRLANLTSEGIVYKRSGAKVCEDSLEADSCLLQGHRASAGWSAIACSVVW